MKIFKSKLNGKIKLCPSKSYTHRQLIASMLSKNETIVSNVDMSDDIKATLSCIKSYVRDFTIENDKVIFKKTDGIKNKLKEKNNICFNANESGSTLRFFFPLALQKFQNATFFGSSKLIERGINIYEQILPNINVVKEEKKIIAIGSINPGNFNIQGNISSQYITGLLYTLPLLQNDSEINIVGDLESKNYILMTLDVLNKSNIQIDIGNQNIYDKNAVLTNFKIKKMQEYDTKDAIIEADYSNAAFIDAFNYFDNNIVLDGLKEDSIQGDKIYKEYFEILNKKYETIDISNCIDLGPVLMAFATLKNGVHITGSRRLKLKESDRANAMACELKKFGAKVCVEENDIYIEKTNLHSQNEMLLSHNDHRIVMSLSLFSNLFDIEIEGEKAINKSYPSFFSDLMKIGLKTS